MSPDVARPGALPRGPVWVFAIFALVGLVSLAAGLATDADRAHRIFLHNWLLWASLSAAALCLSAAFRLTNATWQGPLQRLAESLGAFVPVSLVLYLVIWAGQHHLFHWIHDPTHVEGKQWWYRPGFFFARDLGVLLWINFVSLLYLYISVRPALGRARQEATGWRRRLVERWTAGWRGEAAEQEWAARRGRKAAAVLALSYTFGFSVLGIDLVMSLSPHWVSTMFPAYYSWGGFLSAVSLVTLLALLMRNRAGLRGEVTTRRMHDLGKMIFAFSIFWMYLFWSQYLVIWYGNIPEETGFVVARLGSEFIQDSRDFTDWWMRLAEPYVKITLWTWILLWVIPFWVLLGQKPKKTPAILGSVAALSVLGFWLERYVLVTPSLVTPGDVLAGAPITWYYPLELGIALGFVGLFFLAFLVFARGFPGVLPREG